MTPEEFPHSSLYLRRQKARGLKPPKLKEGP